MDHANFRKYAHQFVDWMADYLEDIEKFPVRSRVAPGEILNQLPETAPATAESMDQIFSDFQRIVLPGITHWQHPSFFAYFPANSSPPSVLAEMLTATLGAQCMLWQTSPAAAEMEERMMQWLAQMCQLPAEWHGVIQDTASTATLCAILTAREKFSQYRINRDGFSIEDRFVVYASQQTHSSIEKAVKIAGLGSENIRQIAVDRDFALRPEILEQQIRDDIRHGFQPLCVVATIGTTGSTAIDPVEAIAAICGAHNVWLHVDAAFAGSAAILPEKRPLFAGVEAADSYVFNPHKWLFTNFDCTAYYVKDKNALLRTFEILPEYLKTSEESPVNNYRDWGIPLGRRFRALKLWFVIRSYGLDGLQQKIRSHIQLAQQFKQWIDAAADFQRLAPVPLNTICFRFRPHSLADREQLDALNAGLLETLNASGKIYLTHTRLNDCYALRMVIGQTSVQDSHVNQAWRLIQETAKSLL